MRKVYRHLFSRFFTQHPDELFFTAHSHHFWPDCTRDAMIEYWDDSCRLVDQKWGYLNDEIIPQTQQMIARRIGSPYPEQITFAPNTHEFVCRLLSCFDPHSPTKILTSDSEFHSFRRQVERMEEANLLDVVAVASQPIESFGERLLAAAKEFNPDMVFFSHVFFNSGLVVDDVSGLVERLSHLASMIVVDGYHSFCAIEIDLKKVADKVFFLSGGYKYAQSGEGVCFLHSPPNGDLRPINTGWFAEFGELEAQKSDEKVRYAKNGNRFAGATFDPSGIYRMRSVLRMLDQQGLDQFTLHKFVSGLRDGFAEQLDAIEHPELNTAAIVRAESPLRDHGHFLTFELNDGLRAESLAECLRNERIHVDFRGSRIRFGFGIYHDTELVSELLERLGRLE